MTELATIEANGIAFPTMAPAATPARRALDLKHWAAEFADVYRVSEALAKTPFVPKEMIGKTADVAAAIMKGRELGLDPFDALGSVYVVHGRVGFYAEFMRRRIIESGHKLRIVESTDNRCVIEGRRKGDTDDEKVRVTYTVEQAKKAGINLGNYPADKLVARATSRITRQHFPDVLAGSLIAEDLIDGLIPNDSEPAAAPAVEAGPAVARKRVSRKPEAAATQPPVAVKPEPQPDDELAELLGDDEPQEPAPAEPVEVEQVEVEVVDEQPAADLVTSAQLKKLSILLREAGFDTPEAKHGFTSTAIGREIGSAKELTEDEATKVIDTLENGEPRD